MCAYFTGSTHCWRYFQPCHCIKCIIKYVTINEYHKYKYSVLQYKYIPLSTSSPYVVCEHSWLHFSERATEMPPTTEAKTNVAVQNENLTTREVTDRKEQIVVQWTSLDASWDLVLHNTMSCVKYTVKYSLFCYSDLESDFDGITVCRHTLVFNVGEVLSQSYINLPAASSLKSRFCLK